MTGSKATSAGDLVRIPTLFTAAIILLCVSGVVYGFVDGTAVSSIQATTIPETTAPIFRIWYLWFVFSVAVGRARTRTAVTILAVALWFMEFVVAYDPAALVAYFVALSTSAAGVMLLYLPQSQSYISIREDRRSFSKSEPRLR
jgi:hypothetical protein